MQVIQEGGAVVKMWTDGVSLEREARDQLVNASKLPFVHKHIAVMPDVHAGKGATIGSVIPTCGAIVPAAVGVDIGCGMIATQTNLNARDLPDDLSRLRLLIEQAIPHGRSNNGGPGDVGAWSEIPESTNNAWNSLHDRRWLRMTEEHPSLVEKNCIKHLGTLGTGNHFIELCLDESDQVWIMLHSGSRGIGNAIGRTFIELAKKDMKRYFINLPDKDLAYIPEGSENFDSYMDAVSWAQDYARCNRHLMNLAVMSVLMSQFPHYKTVRGAINCHHNYVAREHHFGKNVLVTRKGSVRARKGDLGIIPGSMGAKSFIVEGKGNPDSFHSCSHGAGRVMSRTKAKAVFTIEDHIAATKGVECRKDHEVIDETPGAYKDIEAVMAAQQDLVEIKHTLKQVLCVKG